MERRLSADPAEPRATGESGELAVEVAYALPQRAVVKTFRLPGPATVADALAVARNHPEYAEIDWDRSAVGVFGVLAAGQRPLSDGDRIEIYRALAVDPKAARRARAKQKATGPLRPR